MLFERRYWCLDNLIFSEEYKTRLLLPAANNFIFSTITFALPRSLKKLTQETQRMMTYLQDVIFPWYVCGEQKKIFLRYDCTVFNFNFTRIKYYNNIPHKYNVIETPLINTFPELRITIIMFVP